MGWAWYGCDGAVRPLSCSPVTLPEMGGTGGETLAMPITEPAGTACSGVETGPPCTLAMGLGHPKRWARSVHLGRPGKITPAGRRYGVVQIVYHERLIR